jgi:hypothetical protein
MANNPKMRPSHCSRYLSVLSGRKAMASGLVWAGYLAKNLFESPDQTKGVRPTDVRKGI